MQTEYSFVVILGQFLLCNQHDFLYMFSKYSAYKDSPQPHVIEQVGTENQIDR